MKKPKMKLKAPAMKDLLMALAILALAVHQYHMATHNADFQQQTVEVVNKIINQLIQMSMPPGM